MASELQLVPMTSAVQTPPRFPPPHFQVDKDCSICWQRPAHCAKLLRLPCQHLMCTACLQQHKDNRCSFKCQHGEFNRAAELERCGIPCLALAAPTVPVAPTPPLYSERPWSQADDYVARKLQLTGAPQRRGLTTLQVCRNASCEYYDLQSTTEFGEGEFDLAGSPDRFQCPCGNEKCIQQLQFTDCAIRINLCEIFSNGRRKKWECNESAHEGTKVLKLDGFYSRLQVSTVRKLETTITASSGKDPLLSIDADWIEQFQIYLDEVDNTGLNAIVGSLEGVVVPSGELSTLRWAKNTYLNSWGKKRRGTQKLRLRPKPELEEDAILLYYYTLETPPLYHYVSDILNSPETRLQSPEKVRACMPFIKGIEKACANISQEYPEMNYGPAEAYRGMRYRYDDDRWQKFEVGNQICWYTVKSVAATRKAVQGFLGSKPCACTIFKILNCTGTMIKEFSAFDAEDELLIMPGALFDVMDAQRSLKPHDSDVFERADMITLRMINSCED